ncbi:yippee zinc-binding/DNA-binding /Mis18, centromere assembly-domain-containing protein [Leucosporidium creatinivorum]|uniref:Protein yippee-like n=1 Tax=Leucosporidium creatinivorum TaxID=106004 RepID=A0A1Y2F9T5_9BASI|nr:yippee zinc-binding/DNA-binding /Mis18, centromere assembly-domain-containing protein [Leucosporidium creatinivorum]
MSSPPTSPDSTASNPHLIYLPDHVPVYRCANCSIELALQDELVSRAFSGAGGPAYLLRSVINTKVGAKGAKELLTGKHTIAPVTCLGCSAELGWTYYQAPEQSQKYKEGKTILEKAKIYKDNKW